MKKHALTIFFTFATMANCFAASSTTNTTTAKVEKPVSKFAASYTGVFNGPTLKTNDGSYSVNHYFNLKYKFNKKWYLQGVFQPNQQVTNIEKDSSAFTQGQLYFKLGLPTIYKGKNGITIFSQLRYYAPVATSNRNINGKIKPRIYVTKSIGKIDLTYFLNPTIYLNKHNLNGQSTFAHGHFFEIDYNKTDKLAFNFAFYSAWTSQKNQPTDVYGMEFDPGLSYSITDKFSVTGNLVMVLNDVALKNTLVQSTLNYTFL